MEKDERIDDIQFYADGEVEVSEDDVVLFVPARIGEKEAFQRRFTLAGLMLASKGKVMTDPTTSTSSYTTSHLHRISPRPFKT